MLSKVDKEDAEQTNLPYRQHFDDTIGSEDQEAFMNDLNNEDRQDEQKSQLLVVRLLPKAIDYVILLIQLSILASYFYFAYIWKIDEVPQCTADIQKDIPLSKLSADEDRNNDGFSKGVNVTRQFKIAIRWGFWMSLLNFIRAFLAQLGLCLKQWMLLWCSYVLFAANISIMIVLFILMQVWRWSHSGQVCSGDFLESKEDADRDIYLIFEGKFIKAVLIAVYCILGLSCLSVAIIACCRYNRGKVVEQVVDANGNITSVTKPRSTAFNKALDPDYEAAMRETSRSEMKKQRMLSTGTEEEVQTATSEKKKLLV